MGALLLSHYAQTKHEIQDSPIDTFQRDRFNVAALRGKALFIDDDMAKDTRLDDGLLKKISEAKEMSARNAYGRKKFRFRCLTLPVLAGNSFPYTADNSYGLRRRAMVIPFDKVFEDDEVDAELFQKIWEAEMPGVLNRALEGLQRLCERGAFQLPVDCKRAAEDFLASANPLVGFLDAECERDPDGREYLRDLRVAIKLWAKEQGVNVSASDAALTKELEGLKFYVGAQHGKARVHGLRLKVSKESE